MEVSEKSYETSDIAIAAFLLSKGCKREGVDRSNPRRVKFIFEDNEEIQDYIKDFWEYNELICPLTFYQKLRELKMVVHSDN